MFDFLPAKIYYDVYINISLIIVVFTLFHTFILKIQEKKNITYINIIGYIFFVFLVLFIGFRPYSTYFGDMGVYYRDFMKYSFGGELNTAQDPFFQYFMKICSYFLSARGFFVVSAMLYIFPLYRVSKIFFKQYWFYAFLMLATSFSFWSYGVNGMRNGLATSFFLLAVSYYDKKIWMIIFFIISSQIHQTLLLPILAFLLSHLYNNSKWFLTFWVLAIPLSIALGGFWESLFASLGFGDERLTGYLVGNDDLEGTTFSSTGFRYDFLIYSAGAVFTGWYFIFKKNFNDKIYTHLYNIYLFCNGFWILVIRANFSNRFAYLSWFMMALIIIYPFLKNEFFSKHHVMVGKVFTAYFMFTFLMYYFYYEGSS
ncbi:EpsG family protein [Mariniflexile sp.]|uniref:EpsG family protein n=1 Tax=Mariniflexile sp. TaxID=1979402 RepID=UPI00356B33D7